jgi:hypothetical protein
MAHTAPSASVAEVATARLDHLIEKVRQSGDGNTDLLLEHLQSSRTYLLGAMPDEYEFSLITARELTPQVTNPDLRSSITQELRVLLDQLEAATPQPGVSPPRPRRDQETTEEDGGKTKLYRFFRGSATTLGVFYPTHYIFASFPSLKHAENAAKALQAAGFSDCVTASSAETFRFMNEIRSEVGIWGILMASISRFFGTEEVFADIDFAKIEEGAAFLAIYCRREEHAEHIRDLVMPFEPIAMQLYLPGGIRSLIAGKSPGPQGNHSP